MPSFRHRLRCRRARSGADRRIAEVTQRADLVFRRLHRDVIGDAVGRIGPEIGRNLFGGAQAGADIVADIARGDAELQSPRAVDLDVEIRRIDFLLQMRVDDAGDLGDAAAQILGNAQILDAIVADGAHVDLRGEPEIQDLRRDVGRLEIEHVRREAAGSTCRNLRT